MALLIQKYTYDKVIRVFDTAIEGDKINFIDVDFRKLVVDSINNIKKQAELFGKNNIPVTSFEVVDNIGAPPSPLVTFVPELYTQEYYLKKDDPYPGYIKWNSPDQSQFVFTKRNLGDPYYSTVNEEVFFIAQQELFASLDPYVLNENLTAPILNNLLLEQNQNIENNNNEKTMGKGTGSGGQNVQQLLQQLLGYISAATNTQKSVQLPQSVLDKGSIQNSLKKYEEMTSKHKKMQQYLDKAW
jgi:hypothetical protein